MRRLIVGLLGLTALSVGAASAADLPAKAPVYKAPIPVAYNWTGLYVGLHVGGAWGRTTTENVAPFGGFDEGIFESYSLNSSGVFGGGQFGYNWQRSNWVYGLEFDIGYLGLKKEINIPTVPPDDFVSVKYGWYGTFTGRLGYAWNNALLYAKGGGAVARIRNIASDLDGGVFDPADYSETSTTKLGWALGGGLEYGLTPKWSIKGEYLYMDFGKITSTNASAEQFTHRNQVHTAKVGLNYRFY